MRCIGFEIIMQLKVRKAHSIINPWGSGRGVWGGGSVPSKEK